MFVQRIITSVPKVIKRDIGILAPALQKATDPIQQLFLDKIREYSEKNAGGKLVDDTPELQKEKKSELDRIRRQYNIKGDPKEFPKFRFGAPVVEK